ncbi:hypothetical protein ABE236_19315 [Priestia endophytica]
MREKKRKGMIREGMKIVLFCFQLLSFVFFVFVLPSLVPMLFFSPASA